MLTLQGSLFATEEPRVWRPLAEARRTELSAGAWVDHLPGWLGTEADGLFRRLRVEVPWQAERRMMYDREVDVPRLLCHYGEGRDLPDPLLTEARDSLSAHYAAQLGEGFRTAGLCLYRDGRDSVAWHGDRIGRGRHKDTMVAILSLGETRRLALRPDPDRRVPGTTMWFALGHGDLVVMGGSCQRTWQHAVPKTSGPCGPRISIQFRPRGVL
jgi:alkylated DNA repair dioxygenase AlkB